MHWNRLLTMIEAHAEGEVGRVITSGITNVPGRSMLDKMNYLNQEDDTLRRFCVFEPRGYAPMSTNLLVPSTRDDADIGFIIMQSDKAHAMSGSNCICVITVVLETGIVPMHEPETVIRLDMPAGLVVARAHCRKGKCEKVELDMTPSFVEALDVPVKEPNLGELSVDIAFGGVYYALVNPRSLGLSVEPGQARALVEAGTRIHRAVNEQIPVQHPEIADLNSLSYVMFVDNKPDGELIGATVLPPGRIDRSPCGTGNAARLAVRHARGEVNLGDQSRAYSIIDSRFDVTFIGKTAVAGKTAVNARIAGRGWIHGIHHIGVDPSDPYPHGFWLSDCWGDASDLLQ